MRLEFNYVIIDDEFSSPRENYGLKQLITKIDDAIQSKGFKPNVTKYSSVEDFEKNNKAVKNRFDLYLSDNNLDSSSDVHSDSGIDFYLGLHNNFLCDFVLYTRSEVTEIVDKLVTHLNGSQNPNLFSRFTFVSRSNPDEWFTPILNVIDHILSKREEMNNLRGIYAQMVSRIDEHLKKQFNRGREDFKDTIDNLDNSYFGPNFDKKKLHHIRKIRNGLLHNDEYFCDLNKCYVVKYEKRNGQPAYIKETNLKQYRDMLTEAHDYVVLSKRR